MGDFMDKNYRYEIDENNAVSFFDVDNPNENGAPFFFQPDYPNTDSFADKADAQKWADAKMAELINPDAPCAPLGFGHASIPKIPLEQLKAQFDNQPHNIGRE
tara:strand:- start:661 stop:969 length:309 start_codon:yes stop_codon:yes gene_type:complete